LAADDLRLIAPAFFLPADFERAVRLTMEK
jgi:hypothetical protein